MRYGETGDLYEICIMGVQPKYLQQLHDATRLMWTKISKECFQHLTMKN